jgi:hypothetical protein
MGCNIFVGEDSGDDDQETTDEPVNIRQVIENAKILQEERQLRHGVVVSTFEEDIKPSM